MIKRNLDGVYFRVLRNEKWESVCFSDLTQAERDAQLADKDTNWLKALCNYLADVIQDIGEQLDIVKE